MKKITVKGVVVSNSSKASYEEYGIEATAPKDIVLPRTNEAIEVEINSVGGDVHAGSEIYAALKAYSGSVTVKIVGLAASIASVIAMAGDCVEMSPTAQMMIHNAMTLTQGNTEDHEKSIKSLEVVNESIANAYHLKTGKPIAKLREMMKRETWFTAEQAHKQGFCDKIMFKSRGAKYVAMYTMPNNVAYNQLIDRVKIRVHQPPNINLYKNIADTADKLWSSICDVARHATIAEMMREERRQRPRPQIEPMNKIQEDRFSRELKKWYKEQTDSM